MPTSPQDQTEGTFSKLRESFREIFGKPDTASKQEAAGKSETDTGKDHGKIVSS